ncbi:hypothetical protein ABFS82_04G021100 [Erythranthe guttata]|uniref:NAB domain-containing protein n=1 Tax=Erythranthe guttata TaxID=4155 RepID=A0A022S332_ERYGU|nr:PREDICTED: protein NETWORKED 3C [Erythranthe guttata]EYU46656.1 hypothetical protein MIMGU_mgv1a011980mg [Erythranthe guttata]|eukprot:XP_012832893.1 PREDICTED: protein NETWORKED 3C [Erythranthe guttata]
MVEAKNRGSSHSWWFDSHSKGNSTRSIWLQSTLAELDEKAKTMLKLIEEDADSFAQRAEMYYKKRPELISMVEDFYRTHRSLAERYDLVKSENGARLVTPWSSSPLSFTKYRLEKSLSLNLNDKAYDSYSEAYGPDESDESEVDDPEEEETVEDLLECSGTEEVLGSGAIEEELTKLRRKVEGLREENEVQKEQLMQKDEEKREVIRQLSLAMDLLREENLNLRQNLAKNAPKKENQIEYNKLKEGFFGKLFNGFGKSPANLVAL